MEVKAIKEMVLAILAEAGGDELAETYRPNPADNPGMCEELWCHMLHVVAQHLK